MKTYQENKGGSYSIGNMYFSQGNKNYTKMMDEINNGEAELLPYVEPEPTAKEIRDDALNALDYTFGNGQIMKTRPQDEQRIRNTIDYMDKNDITNVNWLMADNKKQPITVTDLKVAIDAAQSASVQIWTDYVNTFE